MKGLSLNTTAIVLYVSGFFIMTGSNIWILTHNIGFNDVNTISGTNLASVLSMSIGITLTQVDIYRKKREILMLREKNIEIQPNIFV